MGRLVQDRRFHVVVETIAVGVFVGLFLSTAAHEQAWPRPWLLSLASGAGGMGVFAAVAAFMWRREGGGRDAGEVDEWLRRGSLPGDVPLGQAMTRLARRNVGTTQGLWSSAVFLALGLFQLLLLPDRGPTVTFIQVFAVALLATFAAWNVYQRARWVPVVRRLIREGQERFAGVDAAATRE